MASTNRIDLTTGSPIWQILRFSLPLVMGSLFQQMYSFVDTIMVGRLISNDALAAVGSVSARNLVVLGFTSSTCSGFSIPLAMDVAGAALATVLCQLISGLLNLRWIIWKTDLLSGSDGLRAFSPCHA